MQIKLRYFAIIRETLGRSEETARCAGGNHRRRPLRPARGRAAAPATDAARHAADGQPGVRRRRPRAARRRRAGADPAGQRRRGGRSAVPRHRPSRSTRARSRRRWPSPAAGAIVTFTGTVRDHARGRSRRRPRLRGLRAGGREDAGPDRRGDRRSAGGSSGSRSSTGSVACRSGEASVVIAVAAPHRDEAFAACRHAIERIKEIVPIWKKEYYADGAVWVGSEAEYQRELGDRSRVDPGCGGQLIIVDKELYNGSQLGDGQPSPPTRKGRAA